MSPDEEPGELRSGPWGAGGRGGGGAGGLVVEERVRNHSDGALLLRHKREMHKASFFPLRENRN